MWVEILSRLVKIDSRYRLKVAGEFQDMRYAVYFRSILSKLELKENIKFFGHVKDIPQWFEREDINYLLSTSIFESFGYNIAEAMAMGVRPLIHNFPGAEELWPIDCLFNTTDELIEMVRNDEGYNSIAYRGFIEQKYPPETQLDKFDNLLKELINENHPSIPQSESQFVQELKNRVNTDTTEKSDSEIEINHHSGAKVKLKVIPGDHMSRTLLSRCFYEQSMLEYIYENYEPGLNFVDVGGHIGNHTVFFSVVCRANRVDTFEPNPLVRKILEENILINHIDNTFLHGMALGASDANGTLEIGPWPHSGMTKVKAYELGEVVIRPLDSVVKESVDILKIDVEGMAGKVLMGGKRILADSRPALFVECADEKEFNEVMSVVQPFGYRPKRRFNATPTIFFEYVENVQVHKITYDRAVKLAT
jgi:FkbM family methyltransferase